MTEYHKIAEKYLNGQNITVAGGCVSFSAKNLLIVIGYSGSNIIKNSYIEQIKTSIKRHLEHFNIEFMVEPCSDTYSLMMFTIHPKEAA